MQLTGSLTHITWCLLFVSLASCAANNMDRDATFNQYTTTGNYQSGLDYSLNLANPGDRDSADQQWLLQSASLSFLMNDASASNDLFTKAERLSRDQDLQGRFTTTANLAKQIAVDQGATKYESTYYEETMINLYKAINYWSMGDVVNARIEFQRLDERQRRSAEFYAKWIVAQRDALEEDEQSVGILAAERQLSASLRQWEPYDGYVNPFATYLDGLFFMINDVDPSDNRRALSSLGRAYGLTGNEAILGDIAIAEVRSNGRGSIGGQTTWVIYEHGAIARKENTRFDIPIYTGTNILYTGIAFPRMKPDDSEQPPLYVTTGSGEPYTTTAVGDMDRIAVAEYKIRLPTLVTKSIASSLVTAVGQTVAQQQFGTGGALAGAVYHGLTNNADTRTWSLLPKGFQVVRIEHDAPSLAVSTSSTLAPKTVDLPAGQQYSVIYVKQTGIDAPLTIKSF